MQLLRKITVRTVYGDKGEVLETVMSDKKKSHALMRVVGVANGVKTGASKQKQSGKDASGQTVEIEVERSWKALLGSFEATNLQTGEVFRSGVCFLPDFAIELVSGQLTEDVDSVRFGFDVTASYDETSATSYVYDVTALMAPAEDDPLTALASQVNATATLPAPAKK